MQLAAGQGGFQHIAGVHGTFRLAGADHGVQLVDEQDDVALLLGQIVQHRLQALLELPAELGPGDQGRHVQRQQAPGLEALGDLAVDDALGQALDDGGLAHPGLADQDRVVLGAPLQDLDGAADLVVAPDHGVELALLGPLGEVDGVLLQGLAGLLGVRVVHRLAAAHAVDGPLQGPLGGPRGAQGRPELAAVLKGGQDEQLRGDVLVLARLGQLVGLVEEATELVANVDVSASPLDLGETIQGLTQGRAQAVDVRVRLGQQVAHRAPLLVQQCDHQVHGLDELVVPPHRQTLGVRQGHLKFRCQLVHPHGILHSLKLWLSARLGNPAVQFKIGSNAHCDRVGAREGGDERSALAL